MEVSAWLKVKGKVRYKGRVDAGPLSISKSKPSTSKDEIAIKLNLNIPDSFFEEPTYTATINLPEVERELPPVASIADNVSEALSKEMGIKIHVTMDAPNSEG